MKFAVTILITEKLTIMKNQNLLLALCLAGFMLPGHAQQPPQTKLVVSITRNINGEKQVIQKEFASKEEMEKYLNEHKVEPFCAGPELPPRLGLSPGCKPMVVKKEVKVEAPTKPDMSSPVNSPAPPATPTPPALPELSDVEIITEDITGNVVENDSFVEEITVIRRVMKKEAVEPPAPETPQSVNDELSRISNLSFFPNPNAGNFYVRFKVSQPSDVHLEIMDLSGKSIYAHDEKNFSGDFEKNIYRSELPAGAYLMEVSVGQETKALKIIVQK